MKQIHCSKEHGLQYLLIPKCASTSIRHILGYPKPQYCYQYMGAKRMSGILFSVVRNPYERVISAYLQNLHKGVIDYGFEEYMNRLLVVDPPDWHSWPQAYFLKYVKLDYLFRIDSPLLIGFLRDFTGCDFAEVWHNKTKDKNIALTWDHKSAIRTIYRDDFDVYNQAL